MVVVDFVKMPPGEMPVGVLQQNKNVDKPDAVDQPDPGAMAFWLGPRGV